MTRESWAVQTECAECGTETHLTSGVCRDCRAALDGMITEWDHGWLFVYCTECEEWRSATNDKDEAADIYDEHARETHVRTL
jgi:predicted amidophosphoribosyltransferase